MNFLNDSFKTLKNVLEEKINFEEENTSENEKLKKLCQHQLEEVIYKYTNEINMSKHFELLQTCLLKMLSSSKFWTTKKCIMLSSNFGINLSMQKITTNHGCFSFICRLNCCGSKFLNINSQN